MSNALNSKIIVSVSSPQFMGTNIPVALKNNPTLTTTFSSLEQLADVTVVDKSNNAGLYYNAQSNKYEIKQLPASETINLDGGTF